jgi:hypothetical protein
MLFESQFRNLIRQLLIEGKVDVLQARYQNIDVAVVASMDPTPQLKYLQWMVIQFENDENVDETDMETTIRKFHSVQQRLPSEKRDINQYKSLEAVKAVLSQIGDTSKTKQKQTTKAEGSQHIGIVDGYDIYFITSHEAAMLLGKGTRWCITQYDGELWDSYVRAVKFFFAIRKQSQGHSWDKIAFACSLNDHIIEVFDAQDKKIYITDTNLYEFVQSIKNQQKDYTVTSKNQTLTITNGKLNGRVKTSQGIEWYKDGKLHREDGPAVEWADGDKVWYKNGQLHREDGPAVEDPNGVKEWWLNGRRHRRGGPAVEWEDGSKEWWINGERHREGGPAVERKTGTKEWWVNGQRHREDGPAIETAKGKKEWWLNGRQRSQEQFEKLTKQS